MSAETRVAGHCYCGAVKVLITLPVKGCVHCHCVACRQAHGAPVVTWLAVLRERFQLAGREHLRWYQDTPTSKRGFCGRCGSPMLFVADRWPDEVHVTRICIFTDVEIAEIAPRAHISYDQHVDWFPFEDSLPRFDSKKQRMD
ncbi:MAG TPA: GFA family protein [Thermoanaerobaculia bacterium]|jgi:hypothetical protein